MRPVHPMLVALAALACARGESAPAGSTAAAGLQEVSIIAKDYGFAVPTTPITAGLTALTLVNGGKEPHQITLFRLTEGKTFADFAAAMQTEGPPPAWAIAAGGPNVALPGSQATATLTLEPGPHALICFIPSPDGVAHAARGMIVGLNVLPATGPSAALPTGDIQMSLNDYSFTMSRPPTAGRHTITVTNQAQQPHEVIIFRLAPGATMEPFATWLAGGMKGQLPGEPVAGVTAFAPGQTVNFSADFSPGTYGLICFVGDAKDGKPHVLHGMSMTFTIS